MPSNPREVVSRRSALQLGAALTGAAVGTTLLGQRGSTAAYAASEHGPGDHGSGAPADGPPHPAVALAATSKFTRALPLLGTQKPIARTSSTDVYANRIVDGTAEILPGVRSRVRTYDGRFPGTIIRATGGAEW